MLSLSDIIKLLQDYDKIERAEVERDIEIQIASHMKLVGNPSASANSKSVVYESFKPFLDVALDKYKQNLKKILIKELKDLTKELEK